MKIIHIYAQNLELFSDLVNGTECRINGSVNLNDVIDSIQFYNARDVLGLIVFANPVTKGCLRLIEEFDNYFSLNSKPIILIADNATELVDTRTVRTKHCKLYPLDSEEDTISDVELNMVFSTLTILGTSVYDLSSIGMVDEKQPKELLTPDRTNLTMSDDLMELLHDLNL